MPLPNEVVDMRKISKMPSNASSAAKLLNPPTDMNMWSVNVVHVPWTVVTIICADALRIKVVTLIYPKLLRYQTKKKLTNRRSGDDKTTISLILPRYIQHIA